jgi:putative SOS response-associated peptidase YedK
MCGRYATTRTALDLSALFEALDETGSLTPTWNAAPTDPVPLVRVVDDGRDAPRRVLHTARWGLVPAWSKDARGAARMINARAETVAATPSFARAFAQHRCLIPADGWYEWQRAEGRRQPFFLTPRDGRVLAFAGIFARWRPASTPGHPADIGEELVTCSIVTTAATGALSAVHDRMPLFLPERRWQEWLTGTPGPQLLRPPSPQGVTGIEIRPVGSAVGNVRNNGPALVKRVEIAADLTLFDMVMPDSPP